MELDPESGVNLTDSGRAQAESIARRHFLIERLLVDLLGFDWVAADEEADELEHALSPRLEDHLFEKLGRHQTCPHGNPFPGSSNELELIRARKLSEAAPGEQITILRITEEGEGDKSLLRFLHDHGLLPGMEVPVEATDNDVMSLAAIGVAVKVPVHWAHRIRVSGPSTL